MADALKTMTDAPAGLLEDLEALEGAGLPRPERRPWQPASLTDVDWLLETMGEIDAETAVNQRIADAATQRILDRLDKANGTLKRQRDYLESLARHYSAEHRTEIIRGKGKTKKLPNGDLSWRKTGGRLALNLDGEGKTTAAVAELLAWAKAQNLPALVRVKEEPAIAEIQKHCAGTKDKPQVVPPGTHYEEPDEWGKLDVTPATEALAKP